MNCWPQVSVVVPVRDAATELRACLDALAEQRYPGDIEVVVVDSGSRRPLADLVDAYPSVRFERCPLTGSYAARNHGARSSSGEFLAFTDADCRPAPGWLEAAVGRLTDEVGRPADAVGGRIEMSYRGARPRGAVEIYESVEAFPQARYVAAGVAATANLVVRRSVFRKLGGFDASAESGGDVDFCRRLSSAGFTLQYASDAVVRHPARFRWRALLAKVRRTTRGVHHMAVAGGSGGAGWWRGYARRQFARAVAQLRLAGRQPELAERPARWRYAVVTLAVRTVAVIEGARCVWRERPGHVSAR